jgi:hypothetical protein
MAGYKAVRRTNLQYTIWISWKAAKCCEKCDINWTFQWNARRQADWDGNEHEMCCQQVFWRNCILKVYRLCLLTAVLPVDSSSACWQQFCLLTAVLPADSSSACWQQFCLLTAVLLADSSPACWQQFCLLTAVYTPNSSTHIYIMRWAAIAQSV